MASLQAANVEIQEGTNPPVAEGVSPSMVGLVGFTAMGPINTPTKVRSIIEFENTFGGPITASEMYQQAKMFFANGGQTAVIVRVVPLNSTAGAFTIDSPVRFTSTAISPGTWSNTYRANIAGNANYIDETIGAERWLKFDWDTEVPDQFGTFLAQEFFSPVQFADDTASDFATRVINDSISGSSYLTLAEGVAGTPDAFAVVSVSGEVVGYGDAILKRFRGTLTGIALAGPVLALGAAGNVTDGTHTYVVTAIDSTGHETVLTRQTKITVSDHTVAGQVGLTVIAVGPTGTVSRKIYRTAAGGVDLKLLTTIADNVTVVYTDNSADSALSTVLDPATTPNPALILRNTGGATKVTITHNAIVITDDGSGNLTATAGLDPSGVNRIDYGTGSYDYTLLVAPAGGVNGTAVYKRLPQQAFYYFSGGTNGVGVITRNEVSAPILQAPQEGMFAFDSMQDIINLVIPTLGENVTVARDMCDYADSRRDRFAILSTPSSTVVDAQIWVANQLQRTTKKAAVYAPRIKVYNDAVKAYEYLSPAAAVAGVYARTDANRNVAKAPAGNPDGNILNSPGPEISYSLDDRNRLVSRKINPIPNAKETGFSVFECLTLSNDPSWQNINVVRLFMFLEEYVFQKLHFALFENNGPALWTRVRSALGGDFTTFYNQGYFGGVTEADSFSIVVDSTNNTTADIEAGDLNVDIGVLPPLPARRVVVRFVQKAGNRI